MHKASTTTYVSGAAQFDCSICYIYMKMFFNFETVFSLYLFNEAFTLKITKKAKTDGRPTNSFIDVFM